MKAFKIRCSAIGHIMTEAKGAITDKQIARIDELQDKESLTSNQESELSQLIYKRDNPELSATCKQYCKDWLKSQIYGRRIEFTSKYTDKGIIMEDESIDFLSKMLNIGMLFKNTDHKEDDFMTGECDVEIPKNIDLICDVKNSWSWETFPFLEDEIPNKDYEWQGHGYMHLWEKNNYKLCYILSNTPVHLIEREARNYCFYNGYGEMDMGIYNEFHKKLTYDDVDDKYKIKIFEFKRDEKKIEAIKNRVIECRKYIEELKTKIKWQETE